MPDPRATLTLPKTETTDVTLALREEILRLKAQWRAVILAHNYQVPEIQDLADYVGDSLGLARQAAETDAETIFRAFRESLFVSSRHRRSRRRGEG